MVPVPPKRMTSTSCPRCVIGDYLTEVNVTSPTCFARKLPSRTGFVAGMMLDALERAVEH